MSTVEQRRLAGVAKRLGLSCAEDGTIPVDRDGLSLVIRDEGDKNKNPSSSIRLGISASLPKRAPSQGGPVYRQQAKEPWVAGRPELLLRKEKESDRHGKKLRLNREVQSGDDNFDSAVYLELHSDASDEVVQQALGSPQTRSTVLELLDGGCDHVKINLRGKDEVDVLLRTDLDGVGNEDILEGTLTRLGELVRSLPRFEGVSTHWRRNSDIALMIVIVVVWLTGLIGASVAYFEWWTFDAAPVLMGILYGLAAWLPWLLLSWFFCRGHSDGLGSFGVLAFGALTGFPTTGIAAIHIVNGAFDPHPPIEHRVEILDKGRCGDDKYCLDVADFRPERRHSSLEVPVDVDTHTKAQKGQQLILTVGPGRLGWPWRIDQRLKP